MLIYLLIVLFILLSIGLITFLLRSDRGEKEPVMALWIAAGLGFIGAIAAVLIERALITPNNIKVGSPLKLMLLSFIGIAIIEESLKFIPLASFIYKKKYFNEHTDGIIYFAIAGLAFGLPENIFYTLQFGSKAGFGRLIMTPFFHAALTGMIGYYLAKAKVEKKNPFYIWPVFLLAISLHAIYDFGLTSGTSLFTFVSVTITLALTANFFYLFFKSKDQDEDMGLAAVGHNSYCRSCGFINQDHYLYCTHCGNRA